MITLLENRIRQALEKKYPIVHCEKCNGQGYWFVPGPPEKSYRKCHCDNGNRLNNIKLELNLRMEAIVGLIVDLAMTADISHSPPVVTKRVFKDTDFRPVVQREIDLGEEHGSII